MRFAVLFILTACITAARAQKLTLAVNLGSPIPIGAFSFYDESAGKQNFTSKYTKAGTIAIGADICYQLNNRVSIRLQPQLAYNKAAMEVMRSDAAGVVEGVKKIWGLQTVIIPLCVGYSKALLKDKLSVTIIGGVSYSILSVAGGGVTDFMRPDASGVSLREAWDNPANTSSVGYVLGVETYPVKKFNRLGFFARYYGVFAATHATPMDIEFTTIFRSPVSVTFKHVMGFKPSILNVGVAYRFTLIK